MTTMEEIIMLEAAEIVRLTTSNFQNWTDRMIDIQRRAKNIQKTLEEGDPEPTEMEEFEDLTVEPTYGRG